MNRLIVPPFPAASRPSKIAITFCPLALTHFWALTSSAWRGRRSASYSALLIGCRYGYSPNLKMRVRSTVAKSSEWSISSATGVFSAACLLDRIGESLGPPGRSACSVDSDFVPWIREGVMMIFTCRCD